MENLTRKTLTKLIKKAGYKDIQRFAEQELGTTYRTFMNQVQQGTLRYKEILVILKCLNCKFEDVAGQDLKKNLPELKEWAERQGKQKSKGCKGFKVL